jgi:hypothetical protein
MGSKACKNSGVSFTPLFLYRYEALSFIWGYLRSFAFRRNNQAETGDSA